MRLHYLLPGAERLFNRLISGVFVFLVGGSCDVEEESPDLGHDDSWRAEEEALGFAWPGMHCINFTNPDEAAIGNHLLCTGTEFFAGLKKQTKGLIYGDFMTAVEEMGSASQQGGSIPIMPAEVPHHEAPSKRNKLLHDFNSINLCPEGDALGLPDRRSLSREINLEPSSSYLLNR